MHTIDNWKVVSRLNSPYQAPELGYSVIQGSCKCHPLVVEGNNNGVIGDIITTSRIKTIVVDPEDKSNIKVSTNNSVYKLGTICPNFQKYLDVKNYTIEDYVLATAKSSEDKQ